MDEEPWFAYYDDTLEVDPGSAADHAFLVGLRARAISRAWSCDPEDTWAYHAIDGHRHLLRVGVWVHTWLTCGVQFDGTRIVGGETYHDIPFDIAVGAEAEIVCSGSIDVLVKRAGEWFEDVLSRPIGGMSGSTTANWSMPRPCWHRRGDRSPGSGNPGRPADRTG